MAPALSVARSTMVTALRGMRMCAIRRAAEKTPIQKHGWSYLLQQEASGRPLSPHINIYKPQLTWMLSGLHRISGCVMAGVLLVGGVGFAVLPINFTQLVDFVRGLNLPVVITAPFKFVIAFPIIYHTLNGIRFIAFDLAKGTDIVSVYRSGYGVAGAAAVLALLVVINAILNKKNTQK